MKRVVLKSLIYSIRQQIILFLALFAVTSQILIAQVAYTYTSESFEETAWPLNEAGSVSTIDVATGTWSFNKKNYVVNTQASDGSNSFYFADKNPIITPDLVEGANILTYYINRPSGGGRTITVSSSINGSDWTEIESAISVPASWTLRTVEINNTAVRYIRFQTNSNGGVYLDNILITPAITTGIPNNNETKIINYRYFDIFGKETQLLNANTIYIQENKYEDGSVKRIKFFNQQ